MEDQDSAMPAKALDKLAKRYGLGPYASRGTSDGTSVPLADPGLLEIIGGIAQALGFAEQVQRIEAFDTALHDARAALRLVRTTMPSGLAGAPSDAIAVSVPLPELPLYR